jgi:hypothetical protein
MKRITFAFAVVALSFAAPSLRGRLDPQANAACSGDINTACSQVNSVLGGKAPVVSGQTGAQLNTLAGSKGDGSDAINTFNVNGVLNVQDYGATCSVTTASATTTSGNKTVTVNAVGDFKVGQHIHIDHAGAANTLATPTLTSVTKYSYNFNPEPTPVYHNSSSDNPGCNTDSTGSPFKNVSCTTPWSYAVVNVAENGSWSAPSTVVTTTNGPSTISADNYIRLKWTTDPTAIGTLIYGCGTSSCAPTLRAVLPNTPVGQISGGATYYDDMGNFFGTDEDFGKIKQAGAIAADLNTTITAIAGTSVTLNTAPSQSGTFTMRHDSAPALAAALAAGCPTSAGATCGTVQLPFCNGYYEIAQPVSFFGLFGPKLVGANDTAEGAGGSQIQWDGPTGGLMFNLNGSAAGSINGIAVPGATGNTPGLVYSADNYTGPGPGGNNGRSATGSLTNWKFYHDEVGQVGVGWTLDTNGSIGNVEDFVWDDFNCQGSQDSLGFGGWSCFLGGSTQTDNERWTKGLVNLRDFGWNGINGGPNHISNINTNNIVDFGNTTGTGNTADVTTIDGWQMGSEYAVMGWAAPLRISDMKDEGGPGPDGYLMVVGGGFNLPTIVENSSIGTFNSPPIANVAGSPNSQIISIGNRYNTAQSNRCGSYPCYPAMPGGLPFTDSNGGQALPSVISIGDKVDVSGYGVLGFLATGASNSLSPYPSQTTVSGTSGTALCSESMQGTLKTATCYLNAYQQTSTAQTYTYPVTFSTFPTLLEGGSGGNSCGTYNPTTSASTLTLPANSAMTAETCTITAIGQ